MSPPTDNPPASRGLRLLALLALAVTSPGAARAADPLRDRVVPFLEAYCVRCHDAAKKSGDLDLAKLASPPRLAEDHRYWEHVVGFVRKEEMPPATAKQPTPDLRREVLAALDSALKAEAARAAGDPGPVAPRRLTNAEYDYTIRDLTGIDIAPAREFPVDPASGEGFRNTGEALTLSPGLFRKYYAAGEHVADHALLTTQGLRFAPHPVVTFADRQKVAEQAILRFYDAHAVDHEAYLAALWLYRHRPADRKAVTVEAWATVRGLSPRYARLLWDAAEGDGPDRFLLRWLRQRWAAIPAPKNPAEPSSAEVLSAIRALANEAKQLGRDLTPAELRAIVPDAGNGPVEHLARRRRMAETRDVFDSASLTGQKASVEVRLTPTQPTARLVLQVAGVGDDKAEGFVVVKAAFTDGKRKGSLRELLTEHATETAERLRFGKAHPDDPRGGTVDPDAFVLRAPALLELDLPGRAFPGAEKVTFTAESRLAPGTPGLAGVRFGDRRPADDAAPGRPLIDGKPEARAEYEASAAAFCRLFPSRFYFADATRGVTAGFHLIEGFFRDDRPQCRSVLTDAENRELDRLWDELRFSTGIWEKMLRGFVFFERSERNFLKHPDFDAFKEEDPALVQDATLARFQEVYLKRAGVKLQGDELARHPISVFFAEVRAGLRWQAEMLKRAEALYLRDVLAFAERAYRRPLTDAERQKLEAFYAEVCRDPEHGIEAAVRASLVRLLVSPHFCLRFDPAPAGQTVAPLPDLALASRLSYFLWSGPPDEELLALAKAGKLADEGVLRGQVRRMVKDPKVSRFALEFFGQWLGHRDFLSAEAVNRQVFPAFDDGLKQALFEEPTRLATHLIQQDRPITDLLNGDATFVNRKLAAHYGLPFAGKDGEWREVTGLRQQGRGGLLGMAVFLTKNSQPQRTSPVKRGFWVVHKLLGEHIPPPPPDVAVLPAKETDTGGKTIRELLKLHVEDAKCARCHQRFDPVGLAMEGFDPIGKARAKDLAGRPVDAVVELPTGGQARGVPEFGDYLVKSRKDDFARTLRHKFLGYALGRSLQLSDEPLLERMRADFDKGGFKLSALFEAVVTSPQFRNQRCRDFDVSKFQAERGAEK